LYIYISPEIKVEDDNVRGDMEWRVDVNEDAKNNKALAEVFIFMSMNIFV
jgi:hypothetical protein